MHVLQPTRRKNLQICRMKAKNLDFTGFLKKYPNIRAGFIHVPYIPSQVVDKPEKPSMSTIDISKGLELSIKAAVENSEDIKAVGGAIC